MSKKELLIHTGIAVVDSIINNVSITNPEYGLALSTSWGLAKAVIGTTMQKKEVKVTEFLQYIIDNPNIFTTKVMQTEEFQDGFVYSLEQYIRERNKQKRFIAQKIFIGFTLSKQKESYTLERYHYTLSTITIDGLGYLLFIKTSILPIYKKFILDKALDTISRPHDGSLQFWKEVTQRDYPISRCINKWIYDNFDPNSEIVKKQYNINLSSKELKDRKLVDQQFEKERYEQYRFDSIIPEFISLGFFLSSTSINIGYPYIEYNITKYFEEFILFIDDNLNS